MNNHIWADYPFPLMSTPALNGNYDDKFIYSATKMALTHNIIIRGMNSIYLQCEYVTSSTARDFITYCQCWCEFIHNHHECEETTYFPVIEKATGIEGITDSNLDQHEAFTSGLEELDSYLRHITPENFCGQEVLRIMNGFAAKLQMHLTDEIVWILSLSKYPDLDMAAIDRQHGLYVRSRSTKARLLPFLLTNHDLTYEEGIHSWWPSGGWMRNWFLRYVCTLVHRGAWKFSSCTISGKPKPLSGIRRNLSTVVVENCGDETGPEIPKVAHDRLSQV